MAHLKEQDIAFHLVQLPTFKLFFKWRNRNLKFRNFGQNNPKWTQVAK